jgi:tetratricopeptide (TPR) repeat protein
VTQLEGTVIAADGKTPYPNAILVATNTANGTTMEVKSDKQGKFVFAGIPPGTYKITVKVMEKEARDTRDTPGAESLASPVAVKEVEKVVLQLQVEVTAGANAPMVINFKDFVAKEGAARAEMLKKQEEERTKFQGMKAHFDAGRVQLESAIAARDEMRKKAAEERGPLTEKMIQSSQVAVTEFEAAKSAAPEADPNMHIVLYNLGQAHDLAGHNDEAIAAYQKAIDLKSDMPAYYLALGTVQARAAKVADAMATCQKASALPATAVADATQISASCYGNVGILLQNSSRMKESIEPLKKAVELNPNNAEYWFLMGRALANAMESKMEGGKMIAIVQPGTAEAYQKYLELAPNGRFADEAKAGLDTLKALGVPIETRVNTKKTKKP